MKHLLKSLPLLAILLPLGCGDAAPRGADPASTRPAAPGPTTADLDREAAATLRAGSAEALAWLRASEADHVVWQPWDREEAVAQVRAMYAAGASKVWAADPTTVGGKSIVSLFVIELPTAPDARRSAFEWIATWEQSHDNPPKPTADVGQRYYEVNLDR